ncbi:hypothetical protein [Actinomadura gamaensis]|uniref:Ig-like domain-containing protein n=1 Tax=Actinomadura gamaensis TaxID=1763541 RepID=A0ABV9TTH8_9ACTN
MRIRTPRLIRGRLSPRAAAGALTLLAGGLTAAGLATAGPASAAPVDIDCPVGTITSTFSPPLTNTTRPVTTSISEHFDCTSVLGDISSGTRTSSHTTNTSCLLAAQPPTTPEVNTYTWNTGQTSTMTYVSDTAVRAADGTVTVTKVGSVTSGLGAGEAATAVIEQPSLSLTACATTGVSSQTGTSTLEIAPA